MERYFVKWPFYLLNVFMDQCDEKRGNYEVWQLVLFVAKTGFFFSLSAHDYEFTKSKLFKEFTLN